MTQMKLTCETIARNILPLFRSLVAKELVEKHDFTQLAAAEKIGTTQAAISQYINSKRGNKVVERFEGILPIIQIAATETAKDIAASDTDHDEVMINFCKICSSIRGVEKV
jgi:predicted transcriptional regulator